MHLLDRFRLTDSVAIVTGAGQGIGRGIAIGLAQAGADVVCSARTQADLDSTVAEIEKYGRRGVAVRGDVLDPDDRERMVAAAVERFGRLDVLVNNVGGSPPVLAKDMSAEYLAEAFQINAIQSFALMKLAMPVMLKSVGRGSIVNISSRASQMVVPHYTAYCAGKAALNHLTRVVAKEWAPRIRINAIAVGGVKTEAVKIFVADPEVEKLFADGTPLKRMGEVEDIAAAALFLASDASSWVTGKVFEIDGGVYAPAMEMPVETL
ncbi:MAG: glucose 1-dehydrogenase [Actinomycetota bacterium]